MERADVLILGGGLVGSALGVALDAHGLSSIIVDIADPDTILAAGFDGRASAIASAPHRMLTAIGVIDRLAGMTCPIEGIRVSDGLEPGALDFASDEPGDALGHMVENRNLRRALYDVAQAAPLVDVRMKTLAVSVERTAFGVTANLSDGTTVHAPLLIAAEGRNSPTREAAHLSVARWSYDHAAMVSSFHHEKSHANIAYEIFYPSGPFALLPLIDDEKGHRSAIVWSVRAGDAAGMLKLSERGWLAEAEKRMGGFLGQLSGLTRRSSYPLGFHHAATITADRLALVGDAAHGIHPIAGQGVNVGFRDVATLVEVLVEGKRAGLDLGDRQLLQRYERWRSLDTFMVSVATDGLTRLFGVPGRTASAVRRMGLSAVQKVPALKDRFMAEARGESGHVPKLLSGFRV
ncbi:UbiH/UbiF/VisC/COQ6 family ubiquinone biosynthesis hydroxylase [Sphingomonas donggukensis]|uniref:UbiH/UbiF/VisC/COQ6 family ubiquinone biosynthesis hydroxylase n=1 Tax=Sphingomonas donggukensis TaxID=2949093 RepID=A0ABY4TUZ4_9SPHN|nr:UbiH/UbiF/VisC/COQ6 family ubiquinone biosynthesis hydroxylase [Sphingomonas donggukensis]URW75297.1 UbiH/UbiF/VisC/COQ6 family ubiquinone biosynthesis hydroxylase [Sphingomonas donggukensis]